MNALPCPFCGSDARIINKTKQTIFTRRLHSIGREYVSETSYLGRLAYVYRVYHYEIKCSKRNCIAANNSRIFRSELAAISAWNQRTDVK